MSNRLVMIVTYTIKQYFACLQAWNIKVTFVNSISKRWFGCLQKLSISNDSYLFHSLSRGLAA